MSNPSLSFQNISYKDINGNEIVVTNKELEQNAKEILEMENVATITENIFSKEEGVSLLTKTENFFNKQENKMFRDDIGEVLVNKKGIKSLLAHEPQYSDKYASIKAIPDVVKKGKILNVSNNWKGRGYDTMVITAPISIIGNRKYMGVVLEQNSDNKNNYYIHELVILDNKYKKSPVNQHNNRQNDNVDLTELVYSLLNNAQNSKSSKDIQGVETDNTGSNIPPMESLRLKNSIGDRVNYR